jgi:hypothetical protein
LILKPDNLSSAISQDFILSLAINSTRQFGATEAAADEEPSDADDQQTEGQKDLNWGAVEEDKRRDQHKVADLKEKLRKDQSSQQQRPESLFRFQISLAIYYDCILLSTAMDGFLWFPCIVPMQNTYGWMAKHLCIYLQR